MNPLIAGIVLILALIFWLLYAYLRISRLRQRTLEAWQELQELLKQRRDHIPLVVDQVRAVAPDESEVFGRVAAAHARSSEKHAPRAQASADEGLKDCMKSLFEIVDRSRELRASAEFGELARKLEQAGDAIQRSKRSYNSLVRDYNLEIQAFPKSFLAGLFGFHEQQPYSLVAEVECKHPRAFP